MNKRTFFTIILTLVLGLSLAAGDVMAADFKIAIMQDKAGAARKFKPLLDYLTQKGVNAKFITAKDYPAAASMFATGKVDAMFSGSGIAGTFIIKGLAEPVVRPVSKSGWSTYWAVVLAKKGSARFNSRADYFKGKKVTFASLASSGEFFFRSIPGSADASKRMMKAASHGAAIDVLNRGKADVAIVKNRVWDKEKGKFPGVERVGEDQGENPNGTLIASKNANASTVKKVSGILQGLKADTSALATSAKDSLGITGYIATTDEDFKHTIGLLKRAGVSESFNFKY